MATFNEREFLYSLADDRFFQYILDVTGKGSLVSYNPLEGGWRNLTFLVVSDQGKFVLRIYKLRTRTEDDIMLELRVIDHLAKHDVPVAKSIPTLDGKRIIKEKFMGIDVDMVLFEYVEGTVEWQFSETQVVNAAAALGKIHAALATFKPEYVKKRWYFGREILRLRRKIVKRLKGHPVVLGSEEERQQFKMRFEKDLKQFRIVGRSYHGELAPKTIVHGDFHGNNIKFEGDEVSGVFDFDSCIMAPRVWDVALLVRSTLLMFLDNPEWEVEKVLKLILKGYLQNKGLRERAFEALIPLVRFSLYEQVAWTLKAEYKDQTDGMHSFFFGQCRRLLETLSTIEASSKLLYD